MACEFFGPIRLSKGDDITAWQQSCVASGRHPKWNGPWKESGHSDVMHAYCCESARDVPPAEANPKQREAGAVASGYLVSMSAEELLTLLDGEPVEFDFGKGRLELRYRVEHEGGRPHHKRK